MTMLEILQREDLSELLQKIEGMSDINALDEQGWTLLHWAAGQDNVRFIRFLVERGADVFRLGRDNRTPYLVALAAGRLEAVQYLAACEEARGSDLIDASSRQQNRRAYCRAYPLGLLREFPLWTEENPGAEGRLSSEDHVFLHQDLTVTRSVLHGSKVLLAASTSEWRTFCTTNLKFSVPTDLELMVTSS
jgi:hypothetical protein